MTDQPDKLEMPTFGDDWTPRRMTAPDGRPWTPTNQVEEHQLLSAGYRLAPDTTALDATTPDATTSPGGRRGTGRTTVPSGTGTSAGETGTAPSSAATSP